MRAAKFLKFARDWAKSFGKTPVSTDAGTAGERRAEDYLRNDKGFAVLARNWRNPTDEREELDLVCRDGATLVFVEVKARSENALVPGYYAVNARKKKILRRAVRAYLARLPHKPSTFRFDIVEIGDGASEVGNRGSGAAVLHFENIPLFSKYYRG